MKSNTHTKLYPFEWTIVLLFCAVVCALTLYSYLHRDKEYEIETGEAVYLAPALIQVRVEGAVLHPGVYNVSRGTTVKEVIEMAQPLEDANLTAIKGGGKVKSKQKIKIPNKKPANKRKRLRNNPSV